MRISAFTIARNADRLYFPIAESIMSILPIVDEYIIALGMGDENDHTKEIIQSIGSKKINILDREWSESKFLQSEILAHETNYALSQCSGDWCFYLQADEVVHENDLSRILEGCHHAHNDKKIEGLLFDYLHFWGDYDHHLPYHGWYKKEIRIIRNKANITSIKDAQSFRKNDGRKLMVKSSGAQIFHYGWVRPPEIMQSKKRIHDGLHLGHSKAEKLYSTRPQYYDYGPLGRIPLYCSDHPGVMQKRIKELDWKDKLNYSGHWNPSRPLNKHEKWHYRLLSLIENKLFGGKEVFGYTNWKLSNE